MFNIQCSFHSLLFHCEMKLKLIDLLFNDFQVPEHLEPGLGDEQLRRLLELELGTSNSTNQKKITTPDPKGL